MSAGPILPVLYRDASLLVLNKPSGLLVHRGWGDDDIVAVDLAREIAGTRVYPVHRLDRGTSGVLLFALDAVTAATVHEAMEKARAEKRYVALVRGTAPESVHVDHPVPRAETGPRVDAVTDVRRLHACGRFSLAEARPRTGRLHQVRRHLKHLGHPVVGDVNYGRGEINRYFRETYALHRIALHAASLALAHPTSGLPLRVSAPWPEDLERVLLALGVPPETLREAIDAA